jgi:DHA1 family multidrug resistance protein-like MFS transporter
MDTRTLWTLLAGNALTAIGIGFFLPILPLFVTARGGAPFLVGVVFAAGFIGRAAAQYPAGWLSDRVGRRPLLLGSLLVYAAIFPLYVLPIPVVALAAIRFVHSLAGGAFVPAAMALAADLTPEGSRGRVFSQLRASDMVGLLLGPALGGFVAGFRLEYVFGAGAVICLVAALVLVGLPAAPRALPDGPVDADLVPLRPARLLLLVLPVLVLGAPVNWTFGAYDSVWSLYLTSRGASTFVVGLSFATYALPIVLFAGLAAGLADRLGHLRAGRLTLATHGLLAASYPFIASVPLLVAIGVVEGGLTAAGVPALNAEVSRRAPAGAQGRTQGMYQLGLNVAQVAGAVVTGALYGLGAVAAFGGVAAACLLGLAASVVLTWRRAT